ncbi:unnamed protein product [Staurois parvus]|uniref:Uncharacterized protein n=1 Tax=Staurois parvus TaxID=386267 RepID=A0ABN9AZ31_9NEOB|nr:unnamed protein product [Staurois parvus]
MCGNQSVNCVLFHCMVNCVLGVFYYGAVSVCFTVSHPKQYARADRVENC